MIKINSEFRRKRLSIWIISISLSFLCTVITSDWNKVWAETQGQQIKIDLPRGDKQGQRLEMAGAKNEYLSLCFEINNTDPSTFKAKVGEQESDKRISFQFYQVVGAPENAPKRFPPDALIPLGSDLNLRALPLKVWVTIHIPPTAMAGKFVYEIIFADKNGTYKQPLELRVWSFALPPDLPITILGNLYFDKNWFKRYGVNSQEQYDEVIRSYLRIMREYKINALGRFYPFPVHLLKPGKRVEDFPGFDPILRYAVTDLNYRYFRIPFVPGAKTQGQLSATFISEAKTYYPLFVDYLRRQHWEEKALIKIIDEPKQGTEGVVYQAYSLIKSLAPTIRTESAGREPNPSLAKVIDIWVTYALFYDPDKITAAKKQGQEIWLYANKLQGADQPLVNQRLIGWYLYRYAFTGYLFWGINYWPQDPWTTVPERGDSFRRGTLLYPDRHTGLPVPTIRLEALRQGFQDYQYLNLLSAAVDQKRLPPEELEKIKTQMELVTENLKSLAPHVNNSQLEKIRLQIGESLNRAEKNDFRKSTAK